MDHLLRRTLKPQCLTSPPQFTHIRTYSTLLGLQNKDLRTQRSEKRPRRRPTRWEIITGEARSSKPLLKVFPAPKSIHKTCPDPVAALTNAQLSTLDPTGARSRLFAKRNPEAAKVGDILLVRQRGGEPFAGVCINIRRRGVDTAILLRNQLTRVGVEMWYKIYSPNVEGIEVVQRRVKRARRERLYYMRLPKHDLGSVQNVVAQYLQRRRALRSGGEVKGRDANAGKRGHVKSK